jgi:acyl-coenzyme A synthetase/AMP-(fatty) acid ligase
VVWNHDVERVSVRKALRKHLESLMPQAHVPNLFVEVDKVPRNHMEKIDRDLLNARVLDAIREQIRSRNEADVADA